MNLSADSPRAIIVEWLRNSAICVALLVVGAGVADLIATTVGRDVPGSYTLGLVIGWAPAAWFAARHFRAKIRWWEYAGGAALFVLLDVAAHFLQLGMQARAYLTGTVWVLLINVYRHYRPQPAPNAATPPQAEA